jgi:hypothetical protein
MANNQMSDYTLNSIKELQNQMTDRLENINEDDDTSTEVDSDKAENAILKAFSNANANASCNSNSNSNALITSKKILGNIDVNGSILTSLLAQHELDRSRISSLTKKLYKLENESEKDELRTHYLRLEFGNTTLALEETKKVLNEYKPYKNYYRTTLAGVLFQCFIYFIGLLYLFAA